ncbi:hypothetical protein HELRODRAFT_161499 [Helobdella robusta]|uniref:CCHC-type domain-containing protein n=1 Tax=Helobdella robusta TaxID=6412 RepID=T1ERK0_HELRO|nr:hypothetical protein HELRODRAFT_161499 [Helobdella robusta]ESO02253.1 hypothetical protein HELRODRAFT_161499 [Helobdella robusta]
MSKLCGLNVVQLREELQKQSLVTSGNKEVLVALRTTDRGVKTDQRTVRTTDSRVKTTDQGTVRTDQGTVRTTEELKQIKKQSERQSERQTEELKQIKEQSERQTEELKQIKDQLKHVKLEVAEQIKEQSTRIEMIEQKLDRQTVEVDHKIDKLKRELEQSKKMAMPLDHASGRTLKVPAFDGEMSWNVYKTQFEAAATSSAAEVLRTIPAENHFNNEVLVSALDLRYGEEHMKQIYRSQLRNRTQRSGESIQQLAQDIERLTLLSYPTSDLEHRDETALDTFIKALRDLELKQSLLLSDKRKLKDAVAHNLTFESAQQASKSDVRLRQIHEECPCQKVVVKHEHQQHGVPQCWVCGEKGHLRRDCKHRLEDNYCQNCATRWRKRREDDLVSRSAPSNEGAKN